MAVIGLILNFLLEELAFALFRSAFRAMVPVAVRRERR